MNLKKYECIYVLRPDLTEDREQKVANRIQLLIESNSGKLMRIDDWGVRKTAYPMQKHSKAHYIQITYAGPAGIVAQLERILRMLDEVMKFHSIKIADQVESEELQQELVRAISKRDEGDRYEKRLRRERDDDRRSPKGRRFDYDDDELLD